MKLRVLLVEDERDTADGLATLVEMWGYEARCAYDGLSALTVAREFQPDVAVLDLGLPKLDGFKVAARLKVECPSVVLTIAVTGYSETFFRARDEHLEASFKAYLVKPVHPPIIQKLLEAAQVLKNVGQ